MGTLVEIISFDKIELVGLKHFETVGSSPAFRALRCQAPPKIILMTAMLMKRSVVCDERL